MQIRGTLLGRVMGLEPTTYGTTIRRSNRLSYTLRVGDKNRRTNFLTKNIYVAQRYLAISISLQKATQPLYEAVISSVLYNQFFFI